MSRSRNVFHHKHLEPFKAWLLEKGFVEEKNKGDFEVLRVRKGKEKPVIFHYRYGSNQQHYTAQGHGLELFWQWKRSQ